MTPMGHRRAGLGTVGIALAFFSFGAHAQVFTVGEKTATADINADFTPTHVELPDGHLGERGRRELMRDLGSEQGFAHRILPLGAIMTLQANGNLTPRAEQYKELIYKKGSSAAPGDRVMITALEFKGDRLVIDLNGGPYPPHRFMRHIQIGIGPVATQQPTLDERATGCRIVLVFEGGFPDISAPEVKALLQPIIDFGAKTGEVAYAETLPAPLKSAIQSHEVLVGMNHRMVLAALGQPESKLREGLGSERYEEWIYGHQPQTMEFVRFNGDRVSLVKIAALGKDIEIHDQDEMAGYEAPVPTVAVGDVTAKDGSAPPSLRLPGEDKTPEEVARPDSGMRKVQMPEPKKTPGTEVPAANAPVEIAPQPVPKFVARSTP